MDMKYTIVENVKKHNQRGTLRGEEMLDARLEAARLRELYRDDPRQQRFTAIIIGVKGTGKTSLLKTARFPAHIDSFDSTGTIPLRKEIDKGDIVADTRYEYDSPASPFAWEEWVRVFRNRVREKYFESFGTYMLDTTTSWTLSNGFYQQVKTNNVGKPMGWTQYKLIRQTTEEMLREIINLPCDVLVTGHIEPKKEYTKIRDSDGSLIDEEKTVSYDYMATGQGDILIPLQFSEKWILMANEGPKGNVVKLLTAKNGLYNASSRLASLGVIDKWEEPNIKNILRKVGINAKDKERLC